MGYRIFGIGIDYALRICVDIIKYEKEEIKRLAGYPITSSHTGESVRPVGKGRKE
jgi:hypothetical protein